MILSVGTVVCLFAFCLVKVLRGPNPSGRLHGLEIDTQDKEER